MQLNILIAVAEFERDIIRERTKAGLAAARARGIRLGRPPLEISDQGKKRLGRFLRDGKRLPERRIGPWQVNWESL